MGLGKKNKKYQTDMPEVLDDFEYIDLDAEEEQNGNAAPDMEETSEYADGLEFVDLDADMEASEELTDTYANAPKKEIIYEPETDKLNMEEAAEKPEHAGKLQAGDTLEISLLDDLEEDVQAEDMLMSAGRGAQGRASGKAEKRKSSKKGGAVSPEASIGERVNAFLQNMFANFTRMDGVVCAFGVFVLIAAIVVVGIWINRVNGVGRTAPTMAETGKQLTEIGILGQSGLMAVTDAQFAKQMALQPEEETDEPEEDEIIEVKVNFTSVEKDLKIKFVNQETGKLINNAEFVVVLTDPSGKETRYTDSDMDGIIYNTAMTPGEYKVEVEAPENYVIVSCDSKVTVRDTIVYEQIDVTDEIKSESEINVATEDTQINAVIEEEVVTGNLTDTVEWVESSRTVIGNESGYVEVAKTTIMDPAQVVSRAFYAMTGEVGEGMGSTEPATPAATDAPSTPAPTMTDTPTPTDSPEETPSPTVSAAPAVTVKSIELNKTTATITVGGDPVMLSVTVTMSDGSHNIGDRKIVWTTSDSGIASVDEIGKVTPVAAGTATITAAFQDSSGNEVKAACQVTVNPYTLTISMDQEKASVYVGEKMTLVATVTKNGTATTSATQGLVTWTSSDTSVAAVDEKTGEVTGVKAGTATITATSTEKDASGNPVKATCTVTVTKGTLEIRIDQENVTVYTGASVTPVATVIQNGKTTTSATQGIVTWSSSDTSVATVNEKTGEVTGVKAGSVTITATTVEKDANGNQLKITVNVTVKTNPAKDNNTKLLDKNGTQIYVQDSSGNYVEAVYADYYTASKFYIKCEVQYRYTGWQTIDNKTYYFDKDGNYVTGEQVIQGVKYNFASDGSLSMGGGTLGIDVSKWNGTIDWNAVRNSGVSFVIIRCGYRGSTLGALIEDSTFRKNIEGATAAGLKVGVYFFSQAINEVEAVEEASMVLSLVKNYRISYPIFIDTEACGGRADNISKETRTAVCRAFCETIQNAGYTAGIYASKSWFTDKINTGSLSAYKIWLAQYATTPTYTGRYDLWQYSSKGRINGISGDVDLNYSYLGY